MQQPDQIPSDFAIDRLSEKVGNVPWFLYPCAETNSDILSTFLFIAVHEIKENFGVRVSWLVSCTYQVKGHIVISGSIAAVLFDVVPRAHLQEKKFGCCCENMLSGKLTEPR